MRHYQVTVTWEVNDVPAKDADEAILRVGEAFDRALAEFVPGFASYVSLACEVVPQEDAEGPQPGEYGYEGPCPEHGDSCDNDHDSIADAERGSAGAVVLFGGALVSLLLVVLPMLVHAASAMGTVAK